MSSPRTAPGPSKAAPSKSAGGRRGEKPAIGRQGEKAAPVKGPKAPKAAKSALPKAQPPKPPSNRAERTAERREAIIEAALDEFISRGFTATRIDDVARRAGVAKGTIYLHFKDKESMFEELIRTALVPLIGRLHAPPPSGGSVRDAVEAFARTFIQEVAATRRGDIVRLIVAEGPRFPSIADFYYREVVSRGLAGMRGLIELAVSRGEIQHKNLARFPQILVAPAIIAVIWQSLFSRHAPLDAIEMFRVHLDLIFGERRTT
jgi:AcrR family transcriptional regulator